MSSIKVVGFDPSMSNWGIAVGIYDKLKDSLSIDALSVTSPVLPKGKQVRQNSKDLVAATQLYTYAKIALEGAQAVFVEVPVGSQSARAMASYAMCVGILGAFKADGVPIYEITPTEVKKIATGKASATKREMIEWAYNQHPDANWPFYKRNGQQLISEGTAEHMADAIATIHAGLKGDEFSRVKAFI